jgi:hypothetical protein
LDILQYDLKGQRLVPKKDKNTVAANSDGYATLFVDHFPEGFEGTAYFRQSWTGSTIVRAMGGDSVQFDEEITTLPDVVNDYIDYKIFVSISATAADGTRLTTNEAVVYVDPNSTAESGAMVLPIGAAIIKEVTEAKATSYDIGKRHESATFSLGFNQGGIITFAYCFTLNNGESKIMNAPNSVFFTVRYENGVAYFENQIPLCVGCIVGN